MLKLLDYKRLFIVSVELGTRHDDDMPTKYRPAVGEIQ